MQILKFKAQIMTTVCFYAIVSRYGNRHLKAETDKMDQNLPITTQKCDLLNPVNYCRGPLHDSVGGSVIHILRSGTESLRSLDH